MGRGIDQANMLPETFQNTAYKKAAIKYFQAHQKPVKNDVRSSFEDKIDIAIKFRNIPPVPIDKDPTASNHQYSDVINAVWSSLK